jgi:hypothetical protein
MIVSEGYSKLVDNVPSRLSEEVIQSPTKRPKAVIKLENRKRNKEAKKSRQFNNRKK